MSAAFRTFRGVTVTEIEVYDTGKPPDPDTGKCPLKARIRQTHGEQSLSNETTATTAVLAVITGVVFLREALTVGSHPYNREPVAPARRTSYRVERASRGVCPGITADAESWAVRVLHYHLSEIYRLNPAVSLYVAIFEKPQGESQTFAELKTVQNFAAGRIRQIGVWCGDRALSGDDLTALQGVADALAGEEAELSVVYAPKVGTLNRPLLFLRILPRLSC